MTKYEGGLRTAAFMYGGFIDRFLGEAGYCKYNRLFHASDLFSTFLQLASGNTLQKDDIDAIVMSYNDTTEVDAIGLWPDIVSQCSDSSGSSSSEDHQSMDPESRDIVIAARMCGENAHPESQYFFSTTIRNNEWKLIVNHTTNCDNPGGPTRNMQNNYWLSYAGDHLETPYFDIYDQYMNNEHIDSELFRSQCLDEMDESERNENNPLFQYDDIMLFKIDTDPIEACNVAGDYPEIVDELLEMLFDTVPGNYYGSEPTLPTAVSALVQYTGWDCDNNRMYLRAWDMFDDLDFDDWKYVWERAVAVKEACS